jgi:hypothetical protein
MLFRISIYCPYEPDFSEFSIDVEAPTEELAKKKITGKTVTCPFGHTFEVEEFFVTSVYPARIFPTPPYKLMSEENVKEAKWLKGAIVEEPLPLGAHPKGSPKLATTIPDSVTTMLYQQEVESKAIRFRVPYVETRCRNPSCHYITPHRYNKCPKCGSPDVEIKEYSPNEVVYYVPIERAKLLVEEGTAEWAYPYPEYTWTIKYRRDVFTKFYEEAKRMAKARKIKEAVLYLVEFSPGITLIMIRDITGAGYWTIWRAIAEYAKPTEEETKRVMSLLDKTAPLEKWTEASKNEIVIELKKPKDPKILIGPLWRGQLTLYPARPKTEKELLEELKRILTLEGYSAMTKEEEEEMRKQMHKYWETTRKQSILYWLSKEDESKT